MPRFTAVLFLALFLATAPAQERRIDPERVGIVGFSAGGRLGASASVQLGDAGPNFSALGKQPSEELVRRFSGGLAVGETTPPAFLAHTSKDHGLLTKEGCS